MKKNFENKKFLVLLIIIIVVIGGYIASEKADKNDDEVQSVWKGKMHYYHDNAFLLPDGKVLLTGETAEIFNPKTRKFKVVGKMPLRIKTGGLYHPKETMLNDGRILSTGGMVFNMDERPVTSTDLKSAEIFDPKTGKTQKVGDMNFRRLYHTATLLNDGRVLIYRGAGKMPKDKIVYNAEIFDQKNNIFTVIPKYVSYSNINNIAILMKDGKVLFVGGDNPLESEIYDPKTNSFYKIGKLNINRRGANAVSLNNGDVLICGGRATEIEGMDKSYYIPCEIFDHKTEKFRLISNFIRPRYSYAMTKLPNGRVLFSGGISGRKYMASIALDSIEIFDPKMEKFTMAGKMSKTRTGHTTIALNNNSVLVIGGYSTEVKNNWDLLWHWVCSLAGFKLDNYNKDVEILKINKMENK